MRRFLLICLCVLCLAANAAAFTYSGYQEYMDQFNLTIKAKAASLTPPSALELTASESDAFRAGYALGLSVSDRNAEDFIINTNTDKFHLPTCYSITKIKPENRYTYHGQRQLLLDLGFTPCANCKP